MTDELTSTFAALADPTRRAILARLALGETSVTEIARPFEMSMPAISKHLKVLERAGLIARGREAQWRPCRLEAGPLKEAAGWIEEYRRFWTPYMDALERHLDHMQDFPADQDTPDRATVIKKKKRTTEKLNAKAPRRKPRV